jgi:hypothetical protein
MSTDKYSLANLRLPERRVRSPIVDRLKRKKAARKRKEFVKLPAVWIDRLVGVGGKTYTVALHLLLLNFRNHGRPFTLGNGQLAAMGEAQDEARCLDPAGTPRADQGDTPTEAIAYRSAAPHCLNCNLGDPCPVTWRDTDFWNL